MKKIISILSFTIFTVFMIAITNAAAANQISVIVNGEKQTYSQAPILENNSVLVPLRGIFESLNAEVEWNGDTQQITIQKDDKTISLQIGSTVAKVNENTLNISTPPKLVNNYTLVPLRFISETLGAEVEWEQATYTVTITTTETNTQPEEQTAPNEPTKNDIVKAEYAASLSQEAMKNKQYETALTKINEALNLDSTNYLYYYNRALIYEALDEKEKAIEDYLKTTELNGEHEQAYTKLAYYYFDKVDYDKAIAAFTKLIELNPNNEDFYAKRAFINFNAKGNGAAAVEDIKKAMELDPKNKEYPALLNKYDVHTFTEEEVNYFIEVATGNRTDEELKRWEGEMRIAIFGYPTQEDRSTIEATLKEINDLIGQEKIKIVGQYENPNLEIYFIQTRDFQDQYEDADTDDEEYAQLYTWNQQGSFKNYYDDKLNHGIMLIADSNINQKERNFFITKRMVQALGLVYESWKYEDSIFYHNEREPKTLTDMDKKMIKIHYYDKVQPGMSIQQVRNTLSN